jgi:hypothetical protein
MTASGALASFRRLERMTASHPKRLQNPDNIPPPLKKLIEKYDGPLPLRGE